MSKGSSGTSRRVAAGWCAGYASSSGSVPQVLSAALRGCRLRQRPASTPGVSPRRRQPATGPPGNYPDRTPTGRRRRACDVRSTHQHHLHLLGARNNGDNAPAECPVTPAGRRSPVSTSIVRRRWPPAGVGGRRRAASRATREVRLASSQRGGTTFEMVSRRVSDLLELRADDARVSGELDRPHGPLPARRRHCAPPGRQRELRPRTGALQHRAPHRSPGYEKWLRRYVPSDMAVERARRLTCDAERLPSPQHSADSWASSPPG